MGPVEHHFGADDALRKRMGDPNALVVRTESRLSEAVAKEATEQCLATAVA